MSYSDLEFKVRKYAKALLVEENRREKSSRTAATGSAGGDDEEPLPSFGDDPKMVAKKFQVRKRESRKGKKKASGPYIVSDPLLLASWQAKPTSEQELASLRADAEEAIKKASQLAGEQVYWCCGRLKPASEVGKGGCVCRNVWRYQVINGW